MAKVTEKLSTGLLTNIALVARSAYQYDTRPLESVRSLFEQTLNPAHPIRDFVAE
jgi:hypothetical protein